MTTGSEVLAHEDIDRLERSSLSYRDFRIERAFRLPEREMTRAGIIRFARRFDPQPFHLDDRAARASFLKGIAASGWHTCSVFMGALQEGFLQFCRDPRLIAVDEIKWLFPVRPGDRIGGWVKARATDAPGPKPGTGQIALDCVATTAEGRRVMAWKARLSIAGFDRPEEGSAAPPEARAHTGVLRAGTLGHFEDVAVGDGVELGSSLITRAEISDFASEFGLQASTGGAAGDVPPEANGWHIASAFMRRLIRYYLREAAELHRCGRPVPQLGPSPGVTGLQWHAPVLAGDTVHFRAWAARKIAIAPRSNWGLLAGGCAGVNQAGIPVISFEAQLLLERRSQLPGL